MDKYIQVRNAEYQAAYNDMKNQMNRQFYHNIPYESTRTGLMTTTFPVQIDPALNYRRATLLRKDLELKKQRLALLERKGKPSYRQRQKNGRNARRSS